MRVTGISTEQEIVDTVLRTLVRLERQRAILEIEGRIEWEGDLDASRQARVTVGDGEDCSADSD